MEITPEISSTQRKFEETQKRLEQAIAAHGAMQGKPPTQAQQAPVATVAIAPESGTSLANSENLLTPTEQLATISQPKQSPLHSSAERTLIATPDILKEYFSGNSSADPLGSMTSTNIHSPQVLTSHETFPTQEPTQLTLPISRRPRVNETKDLPPPSLSATHQDNSETGQQSPLPAIREEKPPVPSPHPREDPPIKTPLPGQTHLHGTPHHGAVSSRVLLSLVTLGGASLLGLMIWLIMR